ncbi:frataxin homolog, mitochondrial [Trichomonascus vanleenenianus]|uniref:ferroxidase n=1 Tax=Trichomonascus vanleenenianus TaxID=2268995 RepID=UPI003ECB2BC7
MLPAVAPRRNLFAMSCRIGTVEAKHVRFNSTAALSAGEFHELSDEALEHLLVEYEDLTELVPEIDVELAQGVLTLVMPPNGTYVINKQPPNQQIWLSSPVSGPKRYDYIEGRWVYARDGSSLGDLLRQETKLVTDAKNVDAIELPELK